MKTAFINSCSPLLALILAGPGFREARAAETPGRSPSTSPAGAPPLTIRVDPRVELVSVLFRLAGNPEYSQGKVASYSADVEKQFGGFRDHAAVKLARELRQRRGVSYDACMSLAIHLRSASDLQMAVPLQPWPPGLDNRWTAADVNRFLEAARQFLKDSGFAEFITRHRSLYETTESRLRALMEKEGHLEWFADYFGGRASATFTLAPALLNGGSCYGSHCRDAAGKDNLYCMLGVWKTGPDGLPEFTHDMLETVIHEFSHSYANPIVDRHEAELRSAADKLFKPVAAKMRSQAYGNSQTMLRESLTRVCQVRYTFRYDGAEAGRRAIAYHQGRGFLWMKELSDLLADYEAHRDRFPTLETFAPQLVAFFNEYAPRFAEQQEALAEKKPRVVSVTPANRARDVDPNLKSITVVFDRPMQDQSWSMVGGGPNYPELTGKPSYDPARTNWTVPVRLKPDWSYQFMLNSGTYTAFRSAEGVPLDPVTVSFRTAGATQP